MAGFATHPRFLYHAELAPSGKLFKSFEDEPADGPKGSEMTSPSGWHTTPAAFDPKWAPPPKSDVPEGSIPAEAAARGYVPKTYPGWRYHKTEPAKLVKSAEEDQALDGEAWKLSPAAHDSDYTEPAPAAPAGDPETEKRATAAFIAKAREFHATPVEAIKKALDGEQDRGKIDRLRNMEMLNPDGPRVPVVKILDNLLTRIAKPERPADVGVRPSQSRTAPVRPVRPEPPAAARPVAQSAPSPSRRGVADPDEPPQVDDKGRPVIPDNGPASVQGEGIVSNKIVR